MNNELTAALLTIEKSKEESGCPAGVDLQDWVKQLAAENVALKSYRDTLDEIKSSLVGGGHGHMAKADMQAQSALLDVIFDAFDDIETLATDRIVAGIKADGVEEFVEKCREKSVQAISSDIRDNWWLAGEHADDFAKQLREGADK